MIENVDIRIFLTIAIIAPNLTTNELNDKLFESSIFHASQELYIAFGMKINKIQ